jgi:hypothetical protein
MTDNDFDDYDYEDLLEEWERNGKVTALGGYCALALSLRS